MRATRLIPVVLTLTFPASARGDTNVITLVTLDRRGGVVHAVPRDSTKVQMAAEEVVLVPYYSPDEMRPMMLVNVWYDLHNTGEPTTLSLGFPELRASWTRRLSTSYGDDEEDCSIQVRDRWPTVQRFGARVGRRWLEVRTHPGLRPYRRWFVCQVSLPGKQTLRLHNVFTSRVGRRFEGYESTSIAMDAPESAFGTDGLRYWFTYVLHTGASWSGSIGKGRILLLHRGRRRVVREFADLEPAQKDDVTLVLPIVEQDQDGKYVVVRNRLVQHSSALDGPVLRHVGALVADGDVLTRWTSARGRAAAAWVQIPADPKGKLQSVEIEAGEVGEGEARPARVRILCVRGGGRQVVATGTLQDLATAQSVKLTRPAGCDAVRVQVDATHGDRGSAVSIAEIRQHHDAPSADEPPRPAKPEAVKPLVGTWPSAAAGAKLPSGTWADSHERDQVRDVQWSKDGSLVHYVRWRENRVRSPRALVLGHFAEVATGRMLGTYRIDRTGKLAPALERQWSEAVSFATARQFMDRHNFAAGKPTPKEKGKLELAPHADAAALQLSPAKNGWRWSYVAPKDPAATGVVALELRGADGPLQRHSLAIDLDLARHHREQREAHGRELRRQAKRWLARGFMLGRAVSDEDPRGPTLRRWLRELDVREQAFTGRVETHWSPGQDALLVAWSDRQELSSRLPLFKANELVWACLQPGSKCPGVTAEYGRQRGSVSIHSLVPRKPSAIQVPVRPGPPPPAKRATTATQRVAAKKGKSGASGCGCRLGVQPRIACWPCLLPVLLVFLSCRRRRARRCHGGRAASRPTTSSTGGCHDFNPRSQEQLFSPRRRPGRPPGAPVTPVPPARCP